MEGFVAYPGELSQENLFQRRTREKVRDDNNSDDQDTLPRSNESFSTDMEDTWGDQAQLHSSLSPIEVLKKILVECSLKKIQKMAPKKDNNFPFEYQSIHHDILM